MSFKRLEELSFSYYDTMPVGYIISRMTSDTARLGETVAWVAGRPFLELRRISCFTADFDVSPERAKLALLVLSVVPVIAVIAVWFQKRILASYRIVRKTNSQDHRRVQRGHYRRENQQDPSAAKRRIPRNSRF